MAHFYGDIRGRSGTVASRCGSKKSGLVAEVMSYDGRVSVRLYRKDEQDFVEITTSPHGDPIYGRRTLYDGLVSELCQHEPLNRLRKSA